jgi:hypothetical protein
LGFRVGENFVDIKLRPGIVLLYREGIEIAVIAGP